ncbi:MAG: chorismate synthase [Oligoflexia bacterium]|nr:chorismate synthase [Oligoflexia bacterium]
MSANSFGNIFRITTFGESHGPAMGVIIQGCPAGIKFDPDLLLRELERRKPGVSALTSERKEVDSAEILSGVFENKTLGTPIAIIVKNTDARSEDYEKIKDSPRAGHADDVWKKKFEHTDYRGGGRSSGRETISRVIGGAVAHMLIREILPQFEVYCYAEKIGPMDFGFSMTVDQKKELDTLLLKAKQEGQSYGGVAAIKIKGLPAGLGQPVFSKIKSDFAKACMSIGATSAIEIGEGFKSSTLTGVELHTEKMQYGGTRGGITTGEDVELKVHFKPTSSILDVAKKGRHDPCIVLRALPVVEAMCKLVIADHLLWAATDKIDNLKRVYEDEISI